MRLSGFLRKERAAPAIRFSHFSATPCATVPSAASGPALSSASRLAINAPEQFSQIADPLGANMLWFPRRS